MSKLTEKLKNKIEAQQLKPKPLWQFKAKASGQWLMVLASVLVLGLIGSLLWYFMAGFDFGLNELLWIRPLLLGRGVGVIVIVLIVFAFLSFWFLRMTNRGYRYTASIILVLILLVGSICSWLFSQLGYGQQLDQSFSNLPFYENRTMFMGTVWQQPDQGRLAGKIIELISGNQFKFRDLDGKEWLVSTDQAIWRHSLTAEVSLEIKMLGEKTGQATFAAQDIRPWMPMMNGGCGGNGNGYGMGMQAIGGCGMMR